MINGIKDCSKCVIPHIEGGYEFILGVLREKVFDTKYFTRSPFHANITR